MAEARNIDTKENYADLLTKALVSEEFHGFYHECMVNRYAHSDIYYDQNGGIKLLFSL